MLSEVLEALRDARRVADVTLGDGGHAEALLRHGVQVLGIDRDGEALARARARLGATACTYMHAGFGSPEALQAVATFCPDGIVADLGVSSRLLDDPSRGFSFRPGVPLDMRMGAVGPTAADVLNQVDHARLARIFAEYGDEPRAKRLAQEVVRRRTTAEFRTSDDLVNAIRAVLGPRSGPGDFARLFQAIRIEVNAELEQLQVALPAWRDAVTPGGYVLVISYHSGEDRLVKHAFHEWSRTCVCPSEQPICTCRRRPHGTASPRKPIRPSAGEIAMNPRSRSAKLRVFRVNDEA
jgi:16S rRNA (cytosine1402-N4)-methyltransferase